MKKLLKNIEKFIEKAIAIHGNKYDYSKVVYISALTKVTIICKEHGEFQQTPNAHLNGQGCSKCSIQNKFLTTEEFIKRSKKIHGDKYDYSKVIYKDSKSKVTIVCPIHGEFEQIPYIHMNGSICSLCNINNNKLSINDFINRSIVKHNNKYDYSKVVYINSKTKITIICHKHGEFEQIPSDHLNGQGCSKCFFENKKLTTTEFIEKAIAIHGNKYDYSKVVYIDSKTKVTIICHEHGEFEQTPNNHLTGYGCSKCNASKGELAIKAILDKHNIEAISEWKFPDEKYLYEYDFYLPEYNLLIEFHGIQHYEWIPYFQETYKDFEYQRDNDARKKWLAELKKVTLLEFNYKQLKYLSEQQFEKLVIDKLNKSILDSFWK